MVGRKVLEGLLLNKNIEKVTIITRRKLGLKDEKLNEIQISSYEELKEEHIKGHDCLMMCLGNSVLSHDVSLMISMIASS